MTFNLTIDTDNDAFAGTPCLELARILRCFANRLESEENASDLEYFDNRNLMDYNGNRVGQVRIEANI